MSHANVQMEVTHPVASSLTGRLKAHLAEWCNSCCKEDERRRVLSKRIKATLEMTTFYHKLWQVKLSLAEV